MSPFLLCSSILLGFFNYHLVLFHILLLEIFGFCQIKAEAHFHRGHAHFHWRFRFLNILLRRLGKVFESEGWDFLRQGLGFFPLRILAIVLLCSFSFANIKAESHGLFLLNGLNFDLFLFFLFWNRTVNGPKVQFSNSHGRCFHSSKSQCWYLTLAKTPTKVQRWNSLGLLL
jgi:hypothetical protein